MEVYEKINMILKNQNLSKREFATKLRNLEPRLKTTGEAPTEKTIYGYLSGRISISIELIPYIADALGVDEQTLFSNTNNSRERFFQNFLKTATEQEINIIKEKFNLEEKLINFVKEPKKSCLNEKESTQNKLITLIPFAPEPLQVKLVKKLSNMKKFTENL